MRRLRVPSQSVGFRLHPHLTLLRYLRADVHASVLSANGLTPRQAVAVESAWRGMTTADDTVADGAPSGWFASDRCLSTWGRSRRNAIEAQTNKRLDELLASVVGAEALPR